VDDYIRVEVISKSAGNYMKQTEFIVLKLTINTTNLAFVVAYRPPGAFFKYFEDEIGNI